jgi:hypothetical protein
MTNVQIPDAQLAPLVCVCGANAWDVKQNFAMAFDKLAPANMAATPIPGHIIECDACKARAQMSPAGAWEIVERRYYDPEAASGPDRFSLIPPADQGRPGADRGEGGGGLDPGAGQQEIFPAPPSPAPGA